VYKRLSPLCLEERQQPVFQVRMHVRCRVPLLKIVSLDTMLSKLRVAKPQLIFAHVMHFMAQSQSGVPQRITNDFTLLPKS